MKRTMVSQMILETIAETMDKQDKKGVEKYGQSLDTVDLYMYDWQAMAMEELADGIKYVTMENVRLKRELNIMKDNYEKEVRKGIRDELNKLYNKMMGGDMI